MTGKTRKDSPIGVIIKGKLAELERSQAWLAKKAGYSTNYIHVIIKGKFIPSNEVVERMAAVLEIDFNTLIAALDEGQ